MAAQNCTPVCWLKVRTVSTTALAADAADDAFLGGYPTERDPMVPPSVGAKLHARLRWSEKDGACVVRDAGSMNGTYVNAVPLAPHQDFQLRDGDALSFGDAQFLYLHTDTLHAHLRLIQDPV
mgnify:CR=1 FL=1